MKQKVLVLGFFGYQSNQLDGQTIKTREIFSLLNFYLPGQVRLFDTQSIKKSKLSFIRMILMILRCRKLVYIPAQNNLKYVFPFIFLICSVLRIKIIYVVVGGWLVDWLKKRRIHRAMLSRISGIYPQSSDLTKKLSEDYGFKNAFTLHNFRTHNFVPFPKPSSDDAFKIVFMARINRKKGVMSVFKLADQFNKIAGRSITINFYGPIEKSFEQEFKEALEWHSFTNYKGIAQPNEIYQTLQDYDLMVLPTQYFTEGFPGSLLDAYIAGIPVVASEWKYAHEFVVDGKTGILFPWNDEEAFVRTVMGLYENPDLLKDLAMGAHQFSSNFSREGAWKILENEFIRK